MYDMIVVKDYDQMDSLHQILECPAQIYSPPYADVSIERLEEVSAAPVQPAITRPTKFAQETSRKRKRDEERVPASRDEEIARTHKKRRISIGIEDIINLEMPKSPRASRQQLQAHGKENLQPGNVYAFVFVTLTV
jgi:hypothetical protein